MGKPKAPKAPDYQAAAKEQGEANLNSSLATTYLDRINQYGPEGSMVYRDTGTRTLPNGTTIPIQDVITTLSPDQQKLYDQNNQISTNLNDLAIGGIDYVGNTVNKPFDTSQLGNRVTKLPGAEDFGRQRDEVVAALMERMAPQLAKQENSLRTRLSNQGFAPGTEAYTADYDVFNRGRNDAQLAAILAGSQEQDRLLNQSARAGEFQNQSREAGIQEQAFFRNEPLNTLNALRTGNQAQMPQFGAPASATAIAPAPIYAATNDGYNAQLKAYEQQMAGYSGLLSGLGQLGGAALTGGFSLLGGKK